jgi:hypothetical protein
MQRPTGRQSGEAMLLEAGLGLLLLAGILYRWITKSFDKWEKLGIAHDKPHFPYGTHNTTETNLATCAHDDYKKFKLGQNLKVHGWFMFGKPALSINDVETLKQLQVKDFNHFVDRNEYNMARLFTKGGKMDKVIV